MEDRQQENEKSIFQKVIDGDVEPVGSQKGWNNLQTEKYSFATMDPKKRSEISRKGAEAVNKIRGEKRTAKEALENILTLRVTDTIIDKSDLDPELADRLKRSGVDITLYDLIQLVAAGRAAGGNMKAYELIRDTYGDMPVKQVEITENITTDQDRAMLKEINELLKAGKIAVIEDQRPQDNDAMIDTIKGNNPEG